LNCPASLAAVQTSLIKQPQGISERYFLITQYDTGDIDSLVKKKTRILNGTNAAYIPMLPVPPYSFLLSVA